MLRFTILYNIVPSLGYLWPKTVAGPKLLQRILVYLDLLLKNKLKGSHIKKVGHARVFSDEEEDFKDYLTTMSDYGFPMVEIDFRYAVKAYLDKKRNRIEKFQQNLAGCKWTKSFFKRREKLRSRMSSNIKKVRANVSAADIESYIDNLKEVVKDIPPPLTYSELRRNKLIR